MKTNHHLMLCEAVAEFIQMHAFDHLLDNEMAQFKSILHQYANTENANELHEMTKKLIPFLGKVNFFVETVSPAAIQSWFYALSYNNIPMGDMIPEMSE